VRRGVALTRHTAGANTHTQDIDLGAVVEGTRQVVRRLRAARAPGVIVVNASSAGLFAMPGREVYSAAKAGAVHFTRSLAHLAPRDGIRVCAVCPRFADTNMVARMRVRLAQQLCGTASTHIHGWLT
jgi:NAD(P)-dependent dehydrogenase (short-subunit alcohol dehydrogenase family)